MSLTKFARIRRQQALREAEGYLDLVTALDDKWPAADDLRDRLARRAIGLLKSLTFQGAQQVRAWYLTGQALALMKHFDKAVAPLRLAAQNDAENIHCWLALGWCYKRCGRLDLAIEALEEALLADRSEAIIHYNLACYWSLASNAKLAIAYLARALDLDPEYRDLIHTESDFDPIRSEPEFQSLASVIV